MSKDTIRSKIPVYMLVFTLGGLFGFVYEEIFYRFDLGYWVKRGTTFGPWVPIYGFGAILILCLTYKVRKNPFLVFLISTLATGLLEFATGYVILKVFGVRLWDYSGEILNWGNIGGFVCARSVLFFGISGLFLRFVVMPLLEKLENAISRRLWLILCFVPAGLFITDIIVSLIWLAVK